MNERYLFITVGSTLGAFAGGWFAARSFYRQQNDQEILEMREYYKSKIEELAGEAIEDTSKKSSEHKTRSEKPSLESIRRGDLDKYKRVVEPYTASETEDEEEARSEDAEVEKEEIERLNDYGNAKVEEHREMAKMDPKIIRMEDYGEEDDFDTTELLYFTEDDKLVTEDEEEIEDPVGLLGNALTKYDFMNNDEDELFVRNFRLRTDYHIRKIDGAFYQ